MIIIIVIVNNISIVIVRIYNFMKNKGVFQWNMASAARVSGAGGGDCCPSGEKGTTPVSVYISVHTEFQYISLIKMQKYNWNRKRIEKKNMKKRTFCPGW